jgi:hypothetical protein
VNDKSEVLTIDDMDIRRNLTFDDFELAMPPTSVLENLRDICADNLDYFQSLHEEVRQNSARQWAALLNCTRVIHHVNGSKEKRRLTLRVVGGEGIITYIAFGGLSNPPRWVSTIQALIGPIEMNPLAMVFRHQETHGGKLPDVWLRGTARGHYPEHGIEVAPFHHLGQHFGNWSSDRDFSGALDKMRSVVAWQSARPHQGKSLMIGPHLILNCAARAEDLLSVHTASLPRSLAETLGLSSQADNLHLQPSGSPWRDGMHRQLKNWSDTSSFRKAKEGILIPAGSEDEASVVVRWLNSFETPAISVYLPMPLDFETYAQAVDGLEV